MPMDFPNMDSLIRHADRVGFRPPTQNETEKEYRESLAKFMRNKDRIESFEIQFGKGWDRWNDAEKASSLFDQ